MTCAIIGCGNALPALDVTNDHMAQLVETSDEWISKSYRHQEPQSCRRGEPVLILLRQLHAKRLAGQMVATQSAP